MPMIKEPPIKRVATRPAAEKSSRAETHEARLLRKANEADVNPGKALSNLSREQLIAELCE